jgi:hypothetical protein
MIVLCRYNVLSCVDDQLEERVNIANCIGACNEQDEECCILRKDEMGGTDLR